MKISIVMISFNKGKFLERAIKSVIEQDYADKEFIIVDACSNDDSISIIEKYRQFIDTIIIEQDDGPADGLNKGFAKATGDIWGYLNADDMYLPGTLSRVSDCFNRYPDKDVISAHGYVIDENDKKLQRFFSHPFNLTAYAVWCCFLMQQSTFFKPRLFRQVNGFNIKNKVCWDGELMVDYALAGAKFKVIRDYWSNFRVYSGSITMSEDYLASLDTEHGRIYKKITDNGYKPMPRPVEWLIVRLRDPISTFKRIVDGLVNPDRKV